MKKLFLFIIVLFAIVNTAFAQTTEPDYLCFEVEAETVIKLTKTGNYINNSVSLEYSYDKVTWEPFTTSSSIEVPFKSFIYFRGNNTSFYQLKGTDSYNTGFYVSKPFKCSGNIMTLLDGIGASTTVPDCAFANLFRNSPIITAPKLPATQLGKGCYMYMFYGCKDLISAPELPAVNLATGCYCGMFNGCRNLTIAPCLPATTLVDNCYGYMFKNCVSLRKAPILPADVVPKWTTYSEMFSGCKNLEYVSVRFTEWTQDGQYSLVTNQWLEDVATTGTFVCPKALQIYNSVSTIPNGWTVKYIEDLHNITIPETSKDYITISETSEIDVGATITFSVTDRTSEGYLATVTVNGTNEIETTKSGNDYTFTMPEEDVTINVTYSPIKYTITTDDYSSVEETEVSAGETVNVTFSQRSGYTLSSAKVNNTDLTITNGAATFTMPAENVSITATYTPIEYTITSDQFSTPNKTKANIGEEITITFEQRSGYTLSSAKVNNTDLTITNGAATFTMPAENVSITATYTAIEYTITSDQYSTPSKTKANIGEEITVSFSQRDGYTLSSAKFNNTALTISNNAAKFTMPAGNVSITATYTPIEYTITSDQYSTPNKTKANVGDEITVSFSQRDGYTLSSAKFNNTALTISNNAAKFTMPAGNVSITATYTPIEYTITSDQYSTPSKTKANVGDEITVNFSQRSGYTLSSAKFNNTALTISNNAAKFTMPAGNVSISATYTPIEYTITSDQYSTPNKTKANIGEEITVTFSQRDDYTLSSAKFNNTALTISNNAAKFTMPAGNVSITTTYTPIEYTITSDQYSTPSKTKANVGDEITVNFSQRDGYTLSSAKFNNTALTISNNAATFTMPAGNVSISATYTPIEYNITANEFVTTNKTKATINDKVTFSVTDRINDGYKLDKILVNGAEFSGTEFEMKNYLQDIIISAVYSKIESENKPEIITDGNVEINLPDNIQENSLVYFTVAQKEGYSAFVYVNGLLTDEYSFVFKGKVEIKVDYKEFSITDITLETEGYCAGDVINMTFTTDNFAKQYEITFSDEGLKEGFKNIDFKDVTAYQKQLEAFKIPENAKPGKYHAFVRVMDSHGSRSKNFVFEFEVFYPNNIIETKYSDLICVNNFNNEFIGYQWLKNNKEVFGENRQFFFDLPFLNGIYSVVLTKNNGDKIRTCNFEVKDIKQKMFVEKSVKVYPNPAKSGEDINLELSGFDNFNGVYILIYNQLGAVISKISNIKNLNTLSLKRGFYTGTVINKNEKLNFKIIVND